MLRKLNLIIIKKKSVIKAVICFFICLTLLVLLKYFFTENNRSIQPQNKSGYVILGANDLGMHCYQKDYSSFLLLPPGNNLKVQVFRNEGKKAVLINSGIVVNYSIIDNTTSSDKINFWQYAHDYGYDIVPNIGITGNGLSGSMTLSDDKKYYEATAIPVTPFNDGSKKLNPYQLARIIVKNYETGEILAETDDIVVPVSNEMDCSICHGTTDTDKNILKKHDELSGTKLLSELAKGKRYKCSDCHRDNILSSPGIPGILPLSQAMHGFHSDKMSQSNVKPECYSCHPGPVSQCYRGVMYAEGISCVNSKCHGDMANIAETQVNGRQAWLQEPNCSNCHGDKYSVNKGILYRNSYLLNNNSPEMNGFILCQSCHNSPHAEWKSTNTKDNLLPESLMGYPDFINKCDVCHEGKGTIHQKVLK